VKEHGGVAYFRLLFTLAEFTSFTERKELI
jgi:hypothetical protein